MAVVVLLGAGASFWQYRCRPISTTIGCKQLFSDLAEKWCSSSLARLHQRNIQQ